MSQKGRRREEITIIVEGTPPGQHDPERLQAGLRILARMIVRAYLKREASLSRSDSGEIPEEEEPCSPPEA